MSRGEIFSKIDAFSLSLIMDASASFISAMYSETESIFPEKPISNAFSTPIFDSGPCLFEHDRTELTDLTFESRLDFESAEG